MVGRQSACAFTLAGALVLCPAESGAQPPPTQARPPQAPPPQAAPPQATPPAQPAGAQPAPGYSSPYPPPHPYAYPYAQLPPHYPYREGTPIPPGYHLESRPRSGFVTAGFVVTGIPYAIGLMAASSATFANASGWLAIPFAGPWLTMGNREWRCLGKSESEQSDNCAPDLILAPLIVDGVIQTIGGTFLLIGYLATKEYVVRDDLALVVAPSPVGSGYGLNLFGAL
jgi:hypothetical protein